MTPVTVPGVRTVTLVLVGPAGDVLGATEPFAVATPWWQEVGEIVERTGVQVLRLLHGDRPTPPGGHVTYLAETRRPPVELAPVTIDLGPDPRRAPYAEVGGPAATVDWAAGMVPDATAHQQRTWNLSAIWRLDDPTGTPIAWVKQVPPFFAHEPVALRLVDQVVPGLVPALPAVGPAGRMVLRHVPGIDGYDAGPDVCARIAAAFHPVQEHFAGRTEPLAAAGVPDGRRLPLGFASRFRPSIAGLDELIEDLPRRLAAVAGCGLPDTLVHGDLHPGNVRIGPDGGLTIMDWGDCVIGNPTYDILRLVERLDDPEPILSAWADRWRASVPGSDPRRAAELLRPVAALRAAAVYAAFLDAIEPAEHPYHAADVPACLASAVAAARSATAIS